MALSRNEIKEKLADIMKMVMRDRLPDLSALREDSHLVNDLGLNSVGVLYIVIAIEEFFGIEFENVGFGDFATIGDVVDYIEQKQQE
ncbi:MAG: acyl carrier protein [Clostridia bacterium]|nr:acyl carrier protein [Clostridia bacterium]